MKYLLLAFFITSILTSCNYDRYEVIQYDIYSSVLDKAFGHFSADIPYMIGINDTIRDIKNELGTLIYSVQNNDLFFKEYCQGDSSFKNFILAIKTSRTETEIMDLEKLKAKTKINIKLNKLIKAESWHYTITFSKIVLNEAKDKAILFTISNSSGSWVFIELINDRWRVKHEIISWVP